MNLARRQDGAATSPGTDATRQGVPMLGVGTAAALLLGILLVMRLTTLPPTWSALALSVVGAISWWRLSMARWRLPAALLVGIGWASLVGQHALDQRLPTALVGEDLQVHGQIVGLPESGSGLQRFDLRVISGEGAAAPLAGSRLRLNRYGRGERLHPGERWSLTVRLRRPRGVFNPGGFDFERHALERRIAATGYVREGSGNERVAAAAGLDAWRDRLSARIADASSPATATRFVRALALGDTRGFDEQDWETLRASGLGHLFAISGFHVGMVAGLAALLAGLAYRAVPAAGLRLPRPQGAALAALAAALAYSAAAGFSLPTLRTLLMIAAVLLARLLRRAHSSTQAFALALIILLVVDPLAALGGGFWLSFLGVGWLLWCLPREPASHPVRSLVRAQGVVTLGLLPITVWLFGQASLVGPALNLVAIPIVTLVVVPLSLMGLGAELLWAGWGNWLFQTAAQAMELGWVAVRWAAELPWAQAWLPEPSLPTLLLALAGAIWCLMPRGTPARWLGLLLLMPMLWPARSQLAKGEIELGVVDVGQGLAVMVRTADRVLLYDTGPAYDGGLDLGEAAVLPALQAQGIAGLDALVVSHGDNDHAGGRTAVLRRLSPRWRFAPAGWGAGEFSPCVAGQGWEWDGVRFDFLHPPLHFPYLGNDASCVLRVRGPYGSALLPGDIGETVETRLASLAPGALRAQVLIVPHHGSRTSSTAAFVDAVSPDVAVYAIGHRNRFGFPRREVVDRYAAAGTRQMDTAASGYLRIRLDQDGIGVAEQWRETRRRFWHETAH